jgi:hypothetical protein
MTVQIHPRSLKLAESKAKLQLALNTNPHTVYLHDPGILAEVADYQAALIQPGDHRVVCMDHPQRRRFAKIKRKMNGTWVVE